MYLLLARLLLELDEGRPRLQLTLIWTYQMRMMNEEGVTMDTIYLYYILTVYKLLSSYGLLYPTKEYSTNVVVALVESGIKKVYS